MVRFAYSILFVIVVSISTTSCSEKPIEDISEFNVSIGMPLDEVKKLYPNSTFQAEHPNKFGLFSGGETGISVYRNDSLLFYFWKHWELDEVGGFILFDPNQAFEGIHTGMSVQDFRTIHPKATANISLLDSEEYLFVPENENWYKIESSTNDWAADYEMIDGEYQFIKFVDTDKKIVSILVK